MDTIDLKTCSISVSTFNKPDITKYIRLFLSSSCFSFARGSAAPRDTRQERVRRQKREEGRVGQAKRIKQDGEAEKEDDERSETRRRRGRRRRRRRRVDGECEEERKSVLRWALEVGKSAGVSQAKDAPLRSCRAGLRLTT
jgi:hypothetical protein